MKKSLLISIFLILGLVTACSIFEQVETPIDVDEATDVPTTVPTDAPLVTYTPTALPQPAATQTPEELEPTTGEAISSKNIDQLTMTVLTDQAMLDNISWLDIGENDLAFLSGNELSIVDAQSNEAISKEVIPEDYYVYDMSPTGDLIACTDDMYMIIILHANTLEQVTLIDPNTAIGNAHFSYDGTKLLITSLEEMVAIEADPLTGEILKTHTGFTTAAPVYDAMYDRYTGEIVWIARGTAQIQNPESEAMSPRFGHQDWINSFSISPDGRWVAFSTTKDTENGYTPGIQIWQTGTGEQEFFIPTNNTSLSLFHSTDGSLIFGADGEQLRFWDAKTGKSLQEFSGHIDGIYQMSLSPDGSSIITSSYDGQTILWQLGN